VGKKSITLGRSLTLVIAITSSVALLQAYVAFVIYDQYTFRTNLVEQLTVLAKVTAGNSAGALYFEDEGGMKKGLSLLSSYPDITYAAAVKENKVFSEYRRPTDADELVESFEDPRRLPELLVNSTEYVELSHDIYQDGVSIGYIYIYADLAGARQRFVRFTLIGGSILVLALLAGLLFTRRLVPFITRPISNLVAVTGSVSRQQDYSAENTPTRISELKALAVGIGIC